MQHVFRYIDQDVWDKLPKEAQDILEHHFFRPGFIKIKGSCNMRTASISDTSSGTEEDADTIKIY